MGGAEKLRPFYVFTINTYMKLYELIKLTEDQYTPKSFFKNDKDDAVKRALTKGRQVVDFLKQKSAPWLEETSMGKYRVYRGFMKDPKHTAFTKKVRKGREPKDSGKESHKAYDFLIKLCKKKANRSNAVFTSGDQWVANDYGQVYIIVPVGKFAYTWHEDHSDWHMDIPWQDILVKKDPKAGGKAVLTKETKWAQEWEEKYTKVVKQVELDRTYFKKFFSQLGIPIQPKQFKSLLSNLHQLFQNTQGDASFNAGTPSNPFPNADRSKLPEYQGWYGDGEKVKLGPMKKLFDVIVDSDKPQKAAIRKSLVMIYNRMRKNRKAESFVQHYPNAKEYVTHQREQLKHGSGHSGGNKNSFKIGKDKVAELDPDYYEAWCKGLHGDDGTLIAGIKTEHEIMVSCNSIIAIDVDFYDEIVVPLLQGKKPKINIARAIQLMDPYREDDNW